METVAQRYNRLSSFYSHYPIGYAYQLVTARIAELEESYSYDDELELEALEDLSYEYYGDMQTDHASLS